MPAVTPTVVRARPAVMSRIGWVCAGIVMVVFVIIAVVMRRDNAGASFGPKDQVGTVVLGILIAAGFWLLTRPRLEADATSVRLRSFAGNYRTVSWDMIVAVEFPSNVRFARLVLPADESFAVYAVQRLDGERAVQTMRELRALHAATRQT
jgi:hypothetical protein